MWIIADYEPVTLFSLKLSTATSSGGKTLLVPTPFSIKMALLDCAFRVLGSHEAEQRWPELRNLQIALRPPERAVVSNLFQKVLRPRRNTVALNEPDAGFFQRTIGYREYVQYVGRFSIALGDVPDEGVGWLTTLLLNVSYLGKRGGFMQLITPPHGADNMPTAHTLLTQDQQAFVMGGTLQILDDCGENLTFDKANIYSEAKIKLGKDRVQRSVVVPYQMKRSSKSFTLYERT